MLAWMTVIAFLSTDIGSEEYTTGGLFSIIHFVSPGAERSELEAELRLLSWMVRKLGHLSEYAVLSFLVCRWVLFSFGTSPQIWQRGGLIISSAYAALDEFHQLYVPTRSGSIVDVMIDLVGVVLGTLLFARSTRPGNRL